MPELFVGHAEGLARPRSRASAIAVIPIPGETPVQSSRSRTSAKNSSERKLKGTNRGRGLGCVYSLGAVLPLFKFYESFASTAPRIFEAAAESSARFRYFKILQAALAQRAIDLLEGKSTSISNARSGREVLYALSSAFWSSERVAMRSLRLLASQGCSAAAERGEQRKEKNMSTWNLLAALEVCKQVEDICPEFGCHVALTGGLLYKDDERKDCDLVFYRIRQIDHIDALSLFAALCEKLGWFFVKDSGWCVKFKVGERDVDCFFPERSDAPVKPASSDYL